MVSGFMIFGLICMSTVAGSAAQAVGQDLADALVSRLRGSDAAAQEEAATSLRRLGPKVAAAVPALIAALNDRTQAVRHYAANCLRHIGPQAKAAIPSLARLLGNKEESESVRSEAALALGWIGPDALEALVEALRPGQDVVARGWAANAIGKMGPMAQPAMPQLVAAPAEEDDRIWYDAGESLIAIGSAAVLPLRRAIESDNPRLRGHAGRTLLKLEPGNRPAIRAMIKDLKHSVSAVRGDAVLALEFAGRDAAMETISPLAEALVDEDAFVREVAARNLSDFGPQARTALPSLIKAMGDPASEVRFYAAEALGNVGVGSEVVVDALTRGIDDEEDVRIMVVRALGRIGPAAASSVPKLKAILGEANLQGELRQSLEESLSRILKE
jgi:HEAT repeat protein